MFLCLMQILLHVPRYRKHMEEHKMHQTVNLLILLSSCQHLATFIFGNYRITPTRVGALLQGPTQEL